MMLLIGRTFEVGKLWWLTWNIMVFPLAFHGEPDVQVPRVSIWTPLSWYCHEANIMGNSRISPSIAMCHPPLTTKKTWKTSPCCFKLWTCCRSPSEAHECALFSDKFSPKNRSSSIATAAVPPPFRTTPVRCAHGVPPGGRPAAVRLRGRCADGPAAGDRGDLGGQGEHRQEGQCLGEDDGIWLGILWGDYGKILGIVYGNNMGRIYVKNLGIWNRSYSYDFICCLNI